jgi:uncharacterized protein YjiS (DUF1127 family)
MNEFQEPRAGRAKLPQLVRPAAPVPVASAPAAASELLAGLGRRLAVVIAGWRARRRARRRLESWLTMDRRVLADIGMRPADVQAAVYAGAPLAERGGRWTRAAGDTVVPARRPVPQLRVVASDDLDAAA